MKHLWLAGVALIAAAGCGGGGAAGGGSAGGPAEPGAGRFDYTPVAAARVDLDFETGKVKVTPLGGDPDGRAIWSGATLEAIANDILVSDGGTSMRSFNLSFKNNTGESIGGADGIRVQFRSLSSLTEFDFRTLASVSTVAGTGVNSSTDGAAEAATTVPHALAEVPGGEVAILDPARLRLLKNGFLTSIAQGISTGSGLAVATDAATKRSYAFIAEQGAHRIRVADLETGVLSAVAGTGTAGDAIGAPGTSQFNTPKGLAWDGQALLVADTLNGKVKRIPITFSPTGVTAGTVTTLHSGLSQPSALAVDAGYLAIAEETAHRIRLTKGSASILIGSGTQGFTAGSGSTARFSSPCALSFSNGDLYVISGNVGSLSVVWRSQDGDPNSPESYLVSLVAGTGAAGYTEGGGATAQFSTQATGLLAQSGRILVGDRNNRRLRAVDLSGFPVDGGFGFLAGGSPPDVRVANRDGLLHATSIFNLGTPYIARQISLAPGETTLFSRVDLLLETGVKRYAFHLVVEAAAGGIASPVGISRGATPGPGSSSVLVERIANFGGTYELAGPAGQTNLVGPVDMDSDDQGNLFIATPKTIVRFDPVRQVFSSIAGSFNSPSQTLDGGAAARFDSIVGIAVTGDGNHIYTIQSNHVVRVTSWNGFADRGARSSYSTGTPIGSPGISGNATGSGAQTRFNTPAAIAVSTDGRRLVVSDSVDNRIFLIEYVGGTTSSSDRLQAASYQSITTNTSTSAIIHDFDFGSTDDLFLIHGSFPFSRISKYSLSIFAIGPWVNDTATDGDTGAILGGYGITGLTLDKSGAVWFMSRGSTSYDIPRLRRAAGISAITTVAGGSTGNVLRGTGDAYGFLAPTGGRFRLADGLDGTIYVLDGRGIHRVSRIIR